MSACRAKTAPHAAQPSFHDAITVLCNADRLRRYQFFQGPTPKTGVQEDLPSFFSSYTLDGAGNGSLVQKATIGVAAIGLVGMAVFLAQA